MMMRRMKNKLEIRRRLSQGAVEARERRRHRRMITIVIFARKMMYVEAITAVFHRRLEY